MSDTYKTRAYLEQEDGTWEQSVNEATILDHPGRSVFVDDGDHETAQLRIVNLCGGGTWLNASSWEYDHSKGRVVNVEVVTTVSERTVRRLKDGGTVFLHNGRGLEHAAKELQDGDLDGVLQHWDEEHKLYELSYDFVEWKKEQRAKKTKEKKRVARAVARKPLSADLFYGVLGLCASAIRMPHPDGRTSVADVWHYVFVCDKVKGKKHTNGFLREVAELWGQHPEKCRKWLVERTSEEQAAKWEERLRSSFACVK